LEDRSIHLLFSANRWECKNKIYEALNSGTTIVVDRYAYSGVAFTSAKGIDLNWCKDPDRQLPAPDIVIYLQLSIEEAKKRGQYGEERYEDPSFQEKVKSIYENNLKDDSWVVLDANQSVEELEVIIEKIALEAIKNNTDKPIRILWTQH